MRRHLASSCSCADVLTYWRCQQCDGNIGELAAFTQLRHLSLLVTSCGTATAMAASCWGFSGPCRTFRA